MNLTSATQSHLHFVNNDMEFWPYGQCIETHLLVQDGLHLNKRGVRTLAYTLLGEVEAFQLKARTVSPTISLETETQNSNGLEHVSVESEVEGAGVDEKGSVVVEEEQAARDVVVAEEEEEEEGEVVGDEGGVVFKWDSKSNLQRIERYRKLWTSGCKCKSASRPCKSRACGCRKFDKPCGPACMCYQECCQNQPSDPTVDGLMRAMYPEEENIIDIVELMEREDYLTDDESEIGNSDVSDIE